MFFEKIATSRDSDNYPVISAHGIDSKSDAHKIMYCCKWFFSKKKAAFNGAASIF
jgi:hypothetical protein